MSDKAISKVVPVTWAGGPKGRHCWVLCTALLPAPSSAQRAQEVLTLTLSYARMGESSLPSPMDLPAPSCAAPCPGEPLSRLLASRGALSLASLHVVVRPGLSLLRSPRQLVTLGQQHHPLLRAAFGPWPTEPSSYSKTRHVNWALKKGRFLSASCAPGSVLRDLSALSHYSLITI